MWWSAFPERTAMGCRTPAASRWRRGSGVGSSSQSLPSSVTAAFFGGTVTANGRFGQTLVSGDFNGDGFSDLAVGAPGQNRVFISYGANGPFQILSGSGDFGAALAVGDFNNDGKQDLAVGAPRLRPTASRGPPRAG